ncbi:MAG: hypothetical protein JF609_11355 [Verrucomicrobia bacterium]|nr:hypothetical protein [Verrucomicrobiota bacterium]
MLKYKRILKWLAGLCLLCIVLLVIFFLSLDPILRWIAVRSIHEQTGMKAEIGSFHLGLRDQSVTIKDLKLYNPPGFGDTPFINIREIHVEYDNDALKKRRELHFNLIRFNLGELDIVKNEAGRTNLIDLGLSLPTKEDLAKSKDIDEIKKRTGLKFTGIDMLNVSVGTARYIDLADQKNNREQNIGLENVPVPNVKTPADLTGLVVLIALRSGDFFTQLASPGELK